MTLSYAKISVEQREVDLKNKPPSLLRVSPKATVPVLILDNGQVLEESIDIMNWALEQSDPDGWVRADLKIQCDERIHLNDIYFKPILDNYKYPQKSEKKDPVYYREAAKQYLGELNSLLKQHRYLLADHTTFADVAIFPFIRQFYQVDVLWFERSDYHFLKTWLDSFLNSALFRKVMEK